MYIKILLIFLHKKLSQIQQFILDTLFPIKCIGCGKENSWICIHCQHKIYLNTEHHCPNCQKFFTPDGRMCAACRRRNPLEALLAATNYHDTIISKAIHLFKYNFSQDIHIPLASLITKSLQKSEIPIPDFIIPIPLHPRRLRWRGFNQSKLLAQVVSQNLLPLSEIPVLENVLFRQRYTKPQMLLERRKDRQQNILKAFSIKNPESIENKVILLIDDVSTTGSTIFECAKVLKQAGAKEVYATVVAKELK